MDGYSHPAILLIPPSALPGINATLNGICALLLTLGYWMIRRKKVGAHKICMGCAFGGLNALPGLLPHLPLPGRLVPFTGRGWIRPVYFTVLISHTILAILIVPMAIMTIYRALRGRFDRHVRIARWTLPLWIYVSLTGVVAVYWMLYRL